MNVDDLLIDCAKMFEHDLWHDLVSAPPDRMLIKDICALAAQLSISREGTTRFGASQQQAAEFITQTENLALMIDKIGGPKRIERSLLWSQFAVISDFANALLDMMAGGA